MEGGTTKPTVLIVDDMPENIEILAEALVKDYEVKVALKGEDALEIAFSNPLPDLILLDIIMPGMSGYDVCRTLKQEKKTRDIPVIFVTVMDEMDDETQGFDAGGVDYITKPIRVPIVLARVKAQLELKQARERLKKQNRILKENLRLKEDVESIVRHDLKTPINVFLWAPDMLIMEGNLSETQLKTLSIMKQASSTMIQTLNSSINIIKMERGEYCLTPEHIDVLRVLKQIKTDMYGLMITKGLAFEIHLSGTTPSDSDSFMIIGEESLVYSMLANLIKNAMEASEEGGTITVSMDEAKTRNIRIHNNGTVPEKIRETFFEKYITSEKKLGTGLGTYSARLMAKTQNGNILLDTSEEKGTTVTIQFPL